MHFFFFTALVLCLLACNVRDPKPAAVPSPGPYDSAYGLINEAMAMVKEGDLVVRNGSEYSSQLVKNFSRADKSYSHAGLVFFQHGYPMVYHIVPDDENPDKKLRADSLKAFAAPRKNRGIGLYRFDLTADEVKNLRFQVEDWKAQGVVFDSAFNPKTDDRMYCSEMIAKGLEKATGGRISVGTTRPTAAEAQFFSTNLHVPYAYAATLDVVAIDNLFLNPHCKAVRRFDYRLQ